MKFAIIVTMIAALSCLISADYHCGYRVEKKDGKNVQVRFDCKETEVCCNHKSEESSFMGKCLECGLFNGCPTSFKLSGFWGSDAKCQAKKNKPKKLK